MAHVHDPQQRMAHVPGFAEWWSPEILAAAISAGIVYLLLTGPFRSRFPGSSPVSRRQQLCFFLGLVCFYFGMGGPLHYYSMYYLFSAHMLQQSLLYFLMVPLMLKGMPAWFFQPLLQVRFWRQLVRLATHPLLTGFLFNAMFSAYHVPAVFDTFYSDHHLHTTYHFLLIIAAFLLWWNIICPVPELVRLSPLRKVAYIFVNGALLLPACALITFSGVPLYQTYLNAPLLFAGHTLLHDQQLGGIVMKFVQEVSYSTALTCSLVEWYRRQQAAESVDVSDRTEDYANAWRKGQHPANEG